MVVWCSGVKRYIYAANEKQVFVLFANLLIGEVWCGGGMLFGGAEV